MREPDLRRAIAAARSVAASAGLAVEDVVVLQSSAKVALRLLPCDVLARVSAGDPRAAQLEVDLAHALVDAGCPVARPDPRLESRAYREDDLAITWWTFYTAGAALSAGDYGHALRRLHLGMRGVEPPAAVPHALDRIESARRLLDDRDLTPELPDEERGLLTRVLGELPAELADRGGGQLLHGEPHAANLLATAHGPLFIDLETCCRGPVEFDLAHAPPAVDEHYPGADLELARRCRLVVLAMVTTWRWDRNDQLPDGRRLAAEWLAQIRTMLAVG